MPYLLATNTSLVSRATLASELRRAGLSVAADGSSPPRRRRPGTSGAGSGGAAVRAGSTGRPESSSRACGCSPTRGGRARCPGCGGGRGDAAEEFTPRNMQSAFTLLRGGARFVAMHRNRWWLTPAGVMLDAGAYVAGLEDVTQRRALVAGKPSRTFFAEGVRRLEELADGIGGRRFAAGGRGAEGRGPRTRRPRPGEVAMVGDDLWNDVLGAQKAGLRGVFVRSGKHGDAELARATAERGGRAPVAVAPSIIEVVAALEG